MEDWYWVLLWLLNQDLTESDWAIQGWATPGYRTPGWLRTRGRGTRTKRIKVERLHAERLEVQLNTKRLKIERLSDLRLNVSRPSWLWANRPWTKGTRLDHHHLKIERVRTQRLQTERFRAERRQVTGRQAELHWQGVAKMIICIVGSWSMWQEDNNYSPAYCPQQKPLAARMHLRVRGLAERQKRVFDDEFCEVRIWFWWLDFRTLKCFFG